MTGVADRQLLLDARTETGSRLGLTARETPAIVDILSERQIREFGARTNVEALNRAPGVTSSLPATSPGAPTMRGFTASAVGLLYDGIRVTTPLIYTRANDSFLFDRIEILKGPASVLYGEGALAGAINLVPKKAQLSSTKGSMIASYGSFDTLRLGSDLNLSLSDRAAVRGVAAYMAVELIAYNGRIILQGVPKAPVLLSQYSVVQKEVEIVGSASCTQEEMEEAIGHLAAGRVLAEDIVTAIVPLEQADAMFDALLDPAGDQLKVLIAPNMQQD